MQTNWDFPYQAKVKRWDLDKFCTIGDVICDLTPASTDKELLANISSSGFFHLYTISLPLNSEVKFGDRIYVPKKDQEFIVRRAVDMDPDPVVEYKEVKACLNTLRHEEYQETIIRKTKRSSTHKDTVTEEFYGLASEKEEEFIVNIEQAINRESYKDWIDRGLKVEVDYIFFTDQGDSMQVKDIFEVRGLRYSVKFISSSAFKIWMVGLESLLNETI